MKSRKKILAIVLLGCLALALSACGSKPFTCDLCMQEKTGKRHTSDLAGIEMTICDECFQDMKSLMGE